MKTPPIAAIIGAPGGTHAGPIAIAGAAAVSSFGLEWRGLGRALRDGAIVFSPSRELAATHPGVPASEVAPIPPADDAGDARQRKLMARAARLAAITAKRALRDAAFAERRDEIGFFLGVGASGGAVSDLEAVLRASMDDDGLSLARLGDQGLSASNPVSTFQLLNNFTLCHAAILEGTGGPNGAFFSRGAGTVFALMEAVAAIAEGDCDFALAGGADSALHPVTWAELVREGYAGRGLIPGEGAGILAIAASAILGRACAAVPLAFIDHASIHGAEAAGGSLEAALEEARASLLPAPLPDLVVLAPWGDPPRAALRSFAALALPGASLLDASIGLGDALAAAPSLAWLAALDLLAAGESRRALILSAGIDGQLGVVALSAPHGGGAR